MLKILLTLWMIQRYIRDLFMMRVRAMRLIVFFDLPTKYSIDRKRYRKFRNFLLNEGFMMEQESVYSKLLLNLQQTDFLTKRIEKNTPSNGLIQVLIVTERQYSQMKYIIGNPNSKIINSEEKLVIL